MALKVILICRLIFRDPQNLPFKTSIKWTYPRQFWPCKVIFRVVTDVWEKDVRAQFQAKSGSSTSCCLFLHFLGRIAVQETSGKTPRSPRHPSSRHPRPSEFLPCKVKGKNNPRRCLGSSLRFARSSHRPRRQKNDFTFSAQSWGQVINANFLLHKVFRQPFGSWTSAPQIVDVRTKKCVFPRPRWWGENFLTLAHPGVKGQEYPQEIRTKTFFVYAPSRSTTGGQITVLFFAKNPT